MFLLFYLTEKIHPIAFFFVNCKKLLYLCAVKNMLITILLKHPSLKIGSNKKREVKLVPDYLLKEEEGFAWTL